jgi:biopolymer transport protein ExbD
MALISNNNDDGMMSEINVTPLVDVMLVLLTVFIVTAPLLMNAVSVQLPKASAAVAATTPETAHISITDAGDIYLNEAQLPEAELESSLKRVNARGDLSVEILADEKVAYGVVAKVMAAIQRAGIGKFTFVMLPEVASTNPIR